MALKLNETEIEGRPIRVERYKMTKAGGSQKSIPKKALKEKEQKKGTFEKSKIAKKKAFLGKKSDTLKKKKEDKKKKLKQKKSLTRKLAKKIAPKTELNNVKKIN